MQCPDTLVPQDELWPDTSMSLVNNNIIMIVSTRLIGENTSMCMFNCCWRSEVNCDYLNTVKQSQAVFLLEYFVILLLHVWTQTYTFLPRHDCDHTIWVQTCVGTNVCGHNRVWAQTCAGTIVCGHKRVWAQSCLGTIVSGHNRVWAQLCQGTNVSGHNRVWAQSCLGTIVSGHNRVWAQSCLGTIVSGHNHVWAQSCVGTIMCGHNRVGSIMYGPNRVVSDRIHTLAIGHYKS